MLWKLVGWSRLRPRRSQGPFPKPSPAKPPFRRKAIFEALESRLLLSADPVGALLPDGLLALQLGDNDDRAIIERIDASAAGGDIVRVTIGGVSREYGDDALGVVALRIDAGGGDDWIRLVGIGAPTEILGGSGRDTLAGPDGDATWSITALDTGVVGSASFASFEHLLGADGNADTFVFSAGALLTGGVDGGAGGFDSVVIDGGAFGRVVHSANGADSGTLDFDGAVLAYAGMEPVVIGAAMTDLVLNASAADDVARLGDAPAAGQSLLDSLNGAFEDVTFVNPTGSLTIHLGGGDDALTIGPLDAGFAAALVVSGDAGRDAVTFAGSLLLPGQSLLVSAERIAVPAGAAVSTENGGGPAGDIVLAAADSSDAALATVDASVTVNGDVRGANVTLNASASYTKETTGLGGLGVQVAVIDADSTATVAILGGAVAASGNLTIGAASTVAATATAVATASLAGADAAVATVIIDSRATAQIGGASSLAAGGDIAIDVANTVTATATADGSGGTAGASVAVAVVDMDTRALVEGAAALAAQNIALRAGSTSAVAATAKSTSGGAADDGTAGNTEAERRLDEYGAATAEAPVAIAGAVAVTDFDATTQASIASSGAIAAAGDALVSAISRDTVGATADGSATTGQTGVGVAVAIDVAGVDTLAFIGGDADLAADTLTVEARTLAASSFGAQAISGAGASDVGAAGSLAINVANTRTVASIQAGANVDVNGADVALIAESHTADTAKALPTQDGATGASLGIGASIALNIGDHDAIAAIEDGARLSGAGDLTLRATGEHALATEATGGAAGGTAVTPVAAIVISNTETAARIGTSAGGTLVLGGGLDAEATQKTTVVTLAEGDAEGDNTAVGLSLGLSVVNDLVLAEIARNVTAGGAIALAASGASSSRSRASAAASGAEEDGSGSPSVDQQAETQRGFGDEQASDRGASDSSDSAANPSASTADGGVSVAAAFGINVADTEAIAKIGDGLTVAAGGALELRATSNTDAAAEADGSTTGGATGIGAAVAIDVANVTTEAVIGANAGVTATGVALHAGMTESPNDDTHSFGAEATSGASAGDVGVAGSLALHVDNVETRAAIAAGASVDANGGDVALEAESRSASTVEALPTEDGATGESVGVGASVAINIGDHDTIAVLEDGASLVDADNVTLAASARHDMTTEAKGGAEGGTAVTPVVAITVANNDATAELGTGGPLTLGGSLTVAATGRTSSSSKAEGDAEGDQAAVGASLALTVASDRVEATTRRDVAAGGDASFLAHGASASSAEAQASATGAEGDDGAAPDDGVDQQVGDQRSHADDTGNANGAGDTGSTSNGSASTSEGGVSVAAAIGVNVATTTSRAAIGDLNVKAGGTLKLGARANTDAAAKADGTAAGEAQTGVGAAVAVNVAKVTNEAVLGAGADVEAGGLVVEAVMTGVDGDTTHAFGAEATSGAGAENVGVAGSVAIDIVNVDTTAAVESGVVAELAGGGVAVTAASATDSTAKALPDDEGAAAGKVGVGASVALNVIDNETAARVASGAQLDGTAGAVAIGAAASHAVTTEAENGASGDTGVGAAVAVAVVNSDTTALLGSGNALTATGDVSVTASQTTAATMKASADAAGGKVGVGASVGVAVVLDTVSAALERNVDAGGGVTVAASSTTSSTIEAKASAKGNSEGALDSDSEADHQVNDNPNSPGEDLNARGANAQSQSSTGNDTAQSNSSTGSQGVGVAAAIGVNVVVTDSQAWIADGLTVAADGAVSVSAQNETDASTKATGTSFALTSSTNVGAAVGLTVANVTNKAWIGANATVSGDGITVAAVTPDEATNDFVAWGLSAAGGKSTSVAGSVAINVATIDTEASVRAGADLDSSGGVAVGAEGDLTLQNVAGAAAAGLQTAGVGAAVAVNVVSNDTKAFIADAAVDAAGAISVTADASLAPPDGDLPLDAMTLAAGGGVTTGNAGIGGSVIVDVFTLETHAFIDDGAAINTAATPSADQSVALRATDLTRVKSGAGGIGGAFGSAGIGIGVDVEVISKDTRAYIGSGAEVHAGGDITVAADADEEVLSVAASAGLAGGSAGVGGSVAVQVLTTGTRAYVESDATVAAGGDLSITADGTADLDLIAGGLAFGSSAGVGIASTTLVHNDTVEAYIDANADVAAGGNPGLVVSASSSEDILVIAAGIGVSGGTAGVAASATVNVLNETTHAWIAEGVAVDATSSGSTSPGVAVSAADATKVLGIAGAVAGAGTAGIGAGADVEVIDKDTQAWIAAGATVSADGNVAVGASSTEDLTSIAAAGGGAGSAAIMGNAGVLVLGAKTRAFLGDDPDDAAAPPNPCIVDAGGSVVVNASDATEVDLITGNISGSGSAGIGAAAGVAVLNKETEAFIGAGSAVAARGLTEADALSGEFTVAFVAAAAADDEVGRPPLGDESTDANQDGADDTTDESFTRQRSASAGTRAVRGVAVGAANRDDIEAIAFSGAASGSVAVNVAAAVVVVDNDTCAFIDDGAQVQAGGSAADLGQSVLVAAANDFYHLGIGASGSLSGAVGVNPGVDVSVIDNSTRAFIDAGAEVAAHGDVLVAANAAEDLLLIAAGISGSGTVAVAGSVTVLSLKGTTEAYIGADADVDAGGNVLVSATDHTEADVIVGSAGIGIGAAGVSASVGVLLFDKDTRAWIDDGASVDGKGNGGTLAGVLDGALGAGFGVEQEFRGVAVQAQSSEDVLHITASAAGGAYAGVAGAVTVTLFDSNTEAWIGAARINTDAAGTHPGQSVNVSAANAVDAFTFAGAIGGGIAGVAGGVDVGSMKNDVSARIAGGAVVNARNDVDVHALSIKALDGFTFSGAGGLVGVAGAVSVWSIGEQLAKSYSDNEGASANALQFEDGGESSDAYAADQGGESQSSVSDPLGGYATGDTADGNDSNTERMHAGTSRAFTALTDNEVSSESVTARVDDPVPAGVQAFVADGANVAAGDDIDVLAKEAIDVQIVSGGLGGGLVGVGAGITVLNVASNTRASLDGTVAAGDDILVKAELDETLKASSLAGGVGFVGLGAAVTVIDDSSTQYAFIGDGADILAADQVSVFAEADQRIDGVDALGGKMTGQAGVGGVAVGASFAKGSMDGGTHAYVGDGADIGQAPGQTVGGLHVIADADAAADAQVFGLGLGAVSISANFSFVDVQPKVEAYIGPGADIDVTGDVEVRALSAGDARAEALAVVIGGLGSVGTSIATATLQPDVDAFVAGMATIQAGASIAIEARHNFGATSPLGGRGAHAKSQVPTAGLLAGSGGVPTATAAADLDTRVDATATLAAGANGTTMLAARAYNFADALGDSDSLAGLGIGVQDVEAAADGTTRAALDGDVTGGANLVVVAQSVNDANARAEASRAGIADAQILTADAFVRPDIAATVGGGADVNVSGSVSIGSYSEGNATARAEGQSLAVLGIGTTFANAVVRPELDTEIAGGANITAGGNVAVESLHNFSPAGARLGHRAFATSTGTGGSLVGAQGATADATAAADVDTRIGAALVDAGGTLSVRSRSSNDADANAEGFNVGLLLSLGTNDADALANGSTLTHLDGGAQLLAGGLDVLADSFDRADARALAGGGGVVSGAGASADADVASTTRSFTGAVAIDAVTDAAFVARGEGHAIADADGVSRGGLAFGSSTANADTNATVEAAIGAFSEIGAGRDFRLQSFFVSTAGGDGRRNAAYAESNASVAGGGAGSDTSSHAGSTVNSRATLGSGASVAAGRDASVLGQADNTTRFVAIGDADAVLAGGFTSGDSDTNTHAIATVGAGAVLEAGDDATVASNANSTATSNVRGGAGSTLSDFFENLFSGNLSGIGIPSIVAVAGSTAEIDVDNDATTTVGVGGAVRAGDNADLLATAMVTVDANATMRAAGTLGSSATALTDVFIDSDAVVRVDDEGSVIADAVRLDAENAIDARSFADAVANADGLPFAVAIAKLNVGTGANPSEARVFLDPGSRIEGCRAVAIEATNHQKTTNLLAHGRAKIDSTVFIGTATTRAEGTVNVRSLVDQAAGATIVSGDLTVHAESQFALQRKPESIADTVITKVVEVVKTVTRTIREKVCEWLPWPLDAVCSWVTRTVEEVVTTFETITEAATELTFTGGAGVQRVDRIDLNGDLFSCAATDRFLRINADGSVDPASNIGVTFDGDDAIVDDILSDGSAKMRFIAPFGTIAGNAVLHVQASLGNARIENFSRYNLVLQRIEPYDLDLTDPDMVYTAASAHEYAFASEIAESTLSIFNATSSDVFFTRSFSIVNGFVEIVNVGGDLLTSSPGVEIQAGDVGHLLLEAGGDIGTANDRFDVELTRGKLMPDGTVADMPAELIATAGGRMWLDVEGVNTTSSPTDLADAPDGFLLNFAAGGTIDVLVSDSRIVDFFPGDEDLQEDDVLVARDVPGRFNVLRAVSATGDVTIDVADGSLLLGRLAGFQGPGPIFTPAIFGLHPANDLGPAAAIVAAPSGTARLRASGAIDDADTDGVADVLASSIDLDAGAGIGAAANFLDLDSSNASPGAVDASAAAGIFLAETAGDLNVGAIASFAGDVTLSADGSVRDAFFDAFTDVSGRSVTLVAGGSIGALGNDLDVDSAASGPGVLTALAGDDAFLRETAGDLHLNLAFAGGRIDLTAPDGAILDAGPGLNLLATSSVLVAAGGVGTAGDFLDAAVSRLEADGGAGGIFLANTGDLAIGGVSPLVGLDAGGEIVVETSGALRVEEDVRSAADVRLHAVDAAAPGRDMTITDGASIASDNGAITLLAGDDFLLEEQATVAAAGAVLIVGDHLNADPGVGSRIELRGLVFGAPILVLGGADGDTVNLWQTAAANPIQILASGGDDAVNVGHGVRFDVNDIKALVSIDGGAGFDTLNVDDSGDGVGNAGILTQTRLTGLGMGSIDQNAVNPDAGLAYGGVELLHAALGSGNDAFFVRGTLPETHLRTGAGDDDVRVGDEASSLDAVAGELFIDAEGGAHNDLRVDDSGDPDADPNAVLTSAAITGLAPAAIHYTATDGAFGSRYDAATKTFFRGIDVRAGTGDDGIAVLSTRSTPGAIEVTTLDAGGGDDRVLVLEADPPYLVVRGGTGDDALDASATTGGVEMHGDADGDALLGGSGADILIGNQGGDFVFGDAGDDILYGDDAAVLRFADYALCRVEPRDLDAGGDDVIEGGHDDDEMRGGAGDDRYVFAGGLLGDDLIVEKKALGGSDTLDFTDFAGPASIDLRLVARQVVNPDHLTLTLTECEAIENVLGSAFDDLIHGNAAGNRLVGAGGDDIVHGHAGDDAIAGNAGDDELFGEEGDDVLDGGSGDDVLLGDIGIVTRLYDPDGTRLLNPNGSWRKEVLLLEPGKVVANREVDAARAIDAGLLGEELWLLAGVQDWKGRWDTRLLAVDLEPAGNDAIRAGDGHDLAFGQRGDDAIDGGAGDDWVEGNEGDDVLAGGEGDDVLIGDSSYHYVATVDGSPTVAHGYELDRETDVECGDVPERGAMVVPLAALTPAGVHGIEPFGAALYQGARDLAVTPDLVPLEDASGRTLTVFGSVIPDVGRHLDLVAGNDELRGDAGDDRLVGDHSAVIAPFQSNLGGMLGDLEHAMSRLAAVDRLLPPHPVQIAVVASDALEGGDGDDALVGDVSLVLVGTASTTGSLAAGLEQAADDFDDAVEAFAKKVKGKPAPVGFTTSGDVLSGDDGADRLIGDHNVVLGIVVDGPAGAGPTPGWPSKVSLGDLKVTGHSDSLYGGGDDDLLVGDSSVQVLAGVGADPFTAFGDGSLVPGSAELAAAGDAGDAVVAPAIPATGIFLPAVQSGAGAGSPGFHAVKLGEMVDELAIVGAPDVLDGGDGDDALIGDAHVQVAALVEGPFAALGPGAKHPDRQLVRVDELVGEIELEGASDRLDGGAGDDLAIGDHAAVVAGVFQGPALTVGAGQGVARSKTTHHDEELVHFTGLVGELSARGAFDVLEGGEGDDALVGDHHALVAGAVLGPVIAGTDAATGFGSDHRFETPIEFSELVGELELCGGGDSLFGGDGDDALIGDSSTHVIGLMAGAALEGPAALVAQASYQHPYWEAIVDFDGLVGRIDSDGSPDELYGGAGDDALVGDDRLVVAGVVSGDLLVAGSGSATLPAKKTQSTALVEFDRLVGSVELEGAMDWLDGGADDDLAVGDHQVLVAGIHAGAVVRADAALVADLAAAHGRLSGEALVDFDRLVECVELEGGADTIAGGAGDDRLLGDHRIDIVAAVAGPLLIADGAGGASAGPPKSAAQAEALVEFENLVGSLSNHARGDSLSGGEGDDQLIGDSALAVAGIVNGPLVAGFPPAAAAALPPPPARLDLVRFERLVEEVALDGDRDALDGGAGDDELVGDHEVAVLGVISGGDDAVGSSAAPQLSPGVEIDGLVGDLRLDGAADTLTGGGGDDCLTGDHALRVAGVIAGPQPADGARVEIESLAGDVRLYGGGDRLDGAAGDDTLIGDHRVAITGLVVLADGALGDREFEVDGAICALRLEGGKDALLGGAGADALYGDHAVSFTGVALPAAEPGGGLAGASTRPPLLEVERLVGSVDIRGNRDALDGGEGDDALYGDHAVSIAGVAGAAGEGRSLRVEIEERLLGCVEIRGADDAVRGGGGDDRAFGDSRIEVAGMAGAVAAGGLLEVEIGGLVDRLDVEAGDDELRGEAGDDALAGDNELLVAGLVLEGGVAGALVVEADGLVGALELGAGCDALDGGDGADALVGDQVLAIAAVLDSTGAPAAADGAIELDIHELVRCLEAEARGDALDGGAGDDLLIGDTRAVVAAYLGSFAAPIAANLAITGDRLVRDFDIEAGGDSLRGRDGADVLVGDGDTTVALAAGAAAVPAGAFDMDALVRNLGVAARGDSLKGDAGGNLIEQGNRAVAPRELVEKRSISSWSKTNAPAAPPAIDWSGAACGAALEGLWGRAHGGAGWITGFVNELGRSPDEQNPNRRIRVFV